MPCPKCHGSKHVQRKGKWVPCDCLAHEEIYRKIEVANLSDILRKGVRRKIVDQDQILDQIKKLISNNFYGIILIQSGSALTRWVVAAMALLYSIGISRSAYSLDFNALIEAYFKDDQNSSRSKIAMVDDLWLRMDFLRKHAWGDNLLSQTLCFRNSRLTILTGIDGLEKAITVSLPLRRFFVNKVSVKEIQNGQ